MVVNSLKDDKLLKVYVWAGDLLMSWNWDLTYTIRCIYCIRWKWNVRRKHDIFFKGTTPKIYDHQEDYSIFMKVNHHRNFFARITSSSVKVDPLYCQKEVDLMWSFVLLFEYIQSLVSLKGFYWFTVVCFMLDVYVVASHWEKLHKRLEIIQIC